MYLLAASGNTIGGTVAGAANVIAFNGNDGVLVDTGTGNAIQQNSIFGHTSGLGIELVNGGNSNLPFPVVSSATSDGNITTVDGLFQGLPNGPRSRVAASIVAASTQLDVIEGGRVFRANRCLNAVNPAVGL